MAMRNIQLLLVCASLTLGAHSGAGTRKTRADYFYLGLPRGRLPTAYRDSQTSGMRGGSVKRFSRRFASSGLDASKRCRSLAGATANAHSGCWLAAISVILR